MCTGFCVRYLCSITCGSKYCYYLHVMHVHFEVHTSRDSRTRVRPSLWLHTAASHHRANCFDAWLRKERASQGTCDTEKSRSHGSE